MTYTFDASTYIVDRAFEFSRKEFVEFLVDHITENALSLGSTHGYTGKALERTVEHHPLRVAREIGFDVIRIAKRMAYKEV